MFHLSFFGNNYHDDLVDITARTEPVYLKLNKLKKTIIISNFSSQGLLQYGFSSLLKTVQ